MATEYKRIAAPYSHHQTVVAVVEGKIAEPITVLFNARGRSSATFYFEDNCSETIEEGGCEYPNGVLHNSIYRALNRSLRHYNTSIDAVVCKHITDIFNDILARYGTHVKDYNVWGCDATLVIIDSTMGVNAALSNIQANADDNHGENIKCLSTMNMVAALFAEEN